MRPLPSSSLDDAPGRMVKRMELDVTGSDAALDRLPLGQPSRLLVAGDGFALWHALNDTIMGGRSSGSCSIQAGALHFDGELVEQGGGFVSVRSPLFSPPLDLSNFAAFQLELAGQGRRFKLAVACADGVAGLTELIPGGLRWVQEFGTNSADLTKVRIGFDQLIPSVRARPIEGLPLGLPLRFDPAHITRLQILHSKFGDAGAPNPGFRPGPLHLEIHAIRATA